MDCQTGIYLGEGINERFKNTFGFNFCSCFTGNSIGVVCFKNRFQSGNSLLNIRGRIADVNELKKVIKKLRNKDADIQKVNKKIIKQHDRLFDLIEGNSSSNSSYSYGD